MSDGSSPPGRTVLQILRRMVPGEWGGIEAVVLNTSKLLPDYGFRAEVLCTKALAPVSFELIEGIPVHRYGYGYPYLGLGAEARARLDGKGGNAISLPMLWALLRWPDVALVHVYAGGRLAAIARTACRLRGIPYVVSLQGGHFATPQREREEVLAPTRGHLDLGRPLGLLLGSRRVLRDAAAVVTIAREEQRAAERALPGRPVHLIPNGVDCEALGGGDGRRFRALHALRDRRIVLSLARIDPQKNQLALVEALPQILEAFPEAALVLVGPVSVREYRARIEARARELGVGDALLVLPGLPPYSDELRAALAATEVFALASVHEPFGIVVLEAWAAGVPVVASKVGGLVDLVVDGANGVHADPEDPESFARAIVSLLRTPERARRMAAAGRERAEHYSWRAVTEQLAELYAEVLADPQPEPVRPRTRPSGRRRT